MAACRAGLGRSPRCMSCTTGRRASPGRRLIAVPPVGSSERLVCRSAGSGNGAVRWHDHAEPCSPPGRAAASRSSAGSRRATRVRGGRCRQSSGTEAREACFRSGPRSVSNHRASLKANGAACGRAAVLASLGFFEAELCCNLHRQELLPIFLARPSHDIRVPRPRASADSKP